MSRFGFYRANLNGFSICLENLPFLRSIYEERKRFFIFYFVRTQRTM